MNKLHEELNNSSDYNKQAFYFVKEINAESDRGAVLFAAAFFEDKLSQIIINYFNNTKILKQVNNFNSKIEFCYNIGFLTKHEYSELHILRDIRNDFAHKFEYMFSFEDEKVTSNCRKFNATISEGKPFYNNQPKKLFINAIIQLHNNLLLRHKLAETYKLTKQPIPLPNQI